MGLWEDSGRRGGPWPKLRIREKQRMEKKTLTGRLRVRVRPGIYQEGTVLAHLPSVMASPGEVPPSPAMAARSPGLGAVEWSCPKAMARPQNNSGITVVLSCQQESCKVNLTGNKCQFHYLGPKSKLPCGQDQKIWLSSVHSGPELSPCVVQTSTRAPGHIT